jgi:hypothetical protein
MAWRWEVYVARQGHPLTTVFEGFGGIRCPDGSSIGISIVITVLGHQAQSSHAELGNSLTPFRPAMQPEALPQIWG